MDSHTDVRKVTFSAAGTTMRQIALSNKKVRGVRRRLEALERWVAEFKDWFPSDLSVSDRKCKFKIPVLSSLVEGKQATRAVQKQFAQRLIDACAHLRASRPDRDSALPVVATVCLPDMFTSEVCVYTDTRYFQISALDLDRGTRTVMQGRSLAREWGLVLPDGFLELGVSVDDRSDPDRNEWYVSEHWYFGDVQCLIDCQTDAHESALQVGKPIPF